MQLLSRLNEERKMNLTLLIRRRTTTTTTNMLFCLCVSGCLVCIFKQHFLVFKQYFTHFNALFHPHVFPQIFLNNNFQFLNICTKRTLYLSQFHLAVVFFSCARSLSHSSSKSPLSFRSHSM